jgi:hypothetical protein
MNMATLFKVAKFLFSNWGTLKTLIAEIMKLFKGETTKAAVDECLNGVCEKLEQKKVEKRRGPWWRRR